MFCIEKPDLIFVQNPSIVLSCFSVIYGKLFKIPVVVDAHNAGVFPFGGESVLGNRIAAYLFQRASFTIVTNQALAHHIETRGGRPIVLPDPLPDMPEPHALKRLRGKHNVLFICSWADDEPYFAVIDAAKLIAKDTFIYVTGNSKGKEKRYAGSLPENVVLTGFLAEDYYIAMLHACDLVVDLTTRPDCLVCGAYEAVSAGKPLITSDSHALREYFSQGVLYTDNSSADIAEKIREGLARRMELAEAIQTLKEEKAAQWAEMMREVERNAFSQVVRFRQ